jgi:3-oxoacyl-[acyl-carrier-protein] synthase-1
MVYLNELGMVCSLGATPEEIKRRMLDLAPSGLTITDVYSPGRLLPFGRVDAELPPLDEFPVPQRSRNNALALTALGQIRPAINAAIESFGLTDRHDNRHEHFGHRRGRGGIA